MGKKEEEEKLKKDEEKKVETAEENTENQDSTQNVENDDSETKKSSDIEILTRYNTPLQSLLPNIYLQRHVPSSLSRWRDTSQIIDGVGKTAPLIFLFQTVANMKFGEMRDSDIKKYEQYEADQKKKMEEYKKKQQELKEKR